ncbi:MAG: DUF1329 domain-containing protein [Pseudomonadota bacterium]
MIRLKVGSSVNSWLFAGIFLVSSSSANAGGITDLLIRSGFEAGELPPPVIVQEDVAPRELGGNDAGTIPAWDGGLFDPPPGHDPSVHQVNPFPNDTIEFTITSSNFRAFESMLTPGQIQMFERNFGFEMPVYETRRTATFPQRVLDASVDNTETAILRNGGLTLDGASGGIPFPVPRSAIELIWNHKLLYRGDSTFFINRQVFVSEAGNPIPDGRWFEYMVSTYHGANGSTEADPNILRYWQQRVCSPTRLAGIALLNHEFLDASELNHESWIYNPGQRRVRRAPDAVYDASVTFNRGLTIDMRFMFNGPVDRYDWEYLGKVEAYIPYNAYELHAAGLSDQDLFDSGRLNSDRSRYELHRVWVIAARVRDGESHRYPLRVFYIDEDSYSIVLTEHYDSDNEMAVFSEAHGISYYDVPAYLPTLITHYFDDGSYVARGVDNTEPAIVFESGATADDMTPIALRQLGLNSQDCSSPPIR